MGGRRVGVSALVAAAIFSVAAFAVPRGAAAMVPGGLVDELQESLLQAHADVIDEVTRVADAQADAGASDDEGECAGDEEGQDDDSVSEEMKNIAAYLTSKLPKEDLQAAFPHLVTKDDFSHVMSRCYEMPANRDLYSQLRGAKESGADLEGVEIVDEETVGLNGTAGDSVAIECFSKYIEFKLMLGRALIDGDEPRVKTLLAERHNFPHDLDIYVTNDGTRQPPLVVAALKGEAGMVEALLEAGANIGAAEAEGFSALHGAAFQAHPSVVQTLVVAGADVDEPAHDGYRALHRALWNPSDQHYATVRTRRRGGGHRASPAPSHSWHRLASPRHGPARHGSETLLQVPLPSR